jgi:hypothetical protein
MRTTIELKDEQRAALLALAARRGMKGFSDLVGEAVDAYLREQAGMDERVQRALRARGGLNAAEADDLRARVAEARSTWRSDPDPRERA